MMETHGVIVPDISAPLLHFGLTSDRDLKFLQVDFGLTLVAPALSLYLLTRRGQTLFSLSLRFSGPLVIHHG